MSASVVWLPVALEDVERLYQFLSEKSPAAAMRAAQIILEGAQRLEATPAAGRPMNDDTGRRELFMAFGAGAYVLRYRIDPMEIVVVVRVWHSRENRE